MARAALATLIAFTLAMGGTCDAWARTVASPIDDETYYTVVAGDSDPGTLVAHMDLSMPDAYRELLFWNPQLHNVYDLRVGQRLRRPGAGARPAFPRFDGDFSRWRVIASHTSRFEGSPAYRVNNIVTAANAVNNFFDDWRHPYVLPRDSLSLNWLLGPITFEKGYEWGHAILLVEGGAIDIPAIGGGICQLPSTIFPAAMKAGLDITRRTNHAYMPYFWWNYAEGFGLDATIDPPYGADLVIRNLYDYPVRFFMRADLRAQTLTAEVYGPPELVPYRTEIDGPYLYRNGEFSSARDAGWVWWAATTVVSQKTYVDGGLWDRPFWSHYVADPYFN